MRRSQARAAAARLLPLHPAGGRRRDRLASRRAGRGRLRHAEHPNDRKGRDPGDVPVVTSGRHQHQRLDGLERSESHLFDSTAPPGMGQGRPPRRSPGSGPIPPPLEGMRAPGGGIGPTANGPLRGFGREAHPCTVVPTVSAASRFAQPGSVGGWEGPPGRRIGKGRTPNRPMETFGLILMIPSASVPGTPAPVAPEQGER